MGIKKNFFYSSILTTANYIFPLLTFPYVTRVLGPTNLGICNFVDSIINYFLLLSMLGIGVVGVREIAKAKNDQKKLSQVFSSLVLLNLISTILALVILFVCVLYIPMFQEYREMMWVGALKILFNTLLIEWFFKGLEDFRYITIRSIIVRTIYVVCVFIFVRSADDYDIYYLLMTLMIVVNAFFNIFYSRKFIKFSFSDISFRPFVSPILIMGLYAVLTSMYTSFNTTYLGLVAGETEVGYYSVATRLYSVLIALFSAFTGVMLPRMSSILSEGRIDDFKNLLNKSVSVLFSFSVPIVIFAIIYAKEIVYIIAGPNFAGAVLPMQICMPLMIIIGYEQIIIIQGLMAMDKNKAVFINSLFGAVVGVVLCVLLMKSLKSVGASIVWFCSELVVLASASVFIKRYIQIRFPLMKLFRTIVYHIPLVIILFLFRLIGLNYWISIFSAFFITSVYLILIQYNFIKEPFILNTINSVINKNKK